MSQLEKAVRRLAQRPKDFSWDELASLLRGLGFKLVTSGGSGRKFTGPKVGPTLFIHEPHPEKTLKAYQVKDAIDILKREGFLP